MRENNGIKNIRKAIRILQEIPLVLSVFVIVCFLFDTYNMEIDWHICPLFGFSVYILLRLYAASRRLYVSRWSRMLYLNLVMVASVDFLDSVFNSSTRFINLQEFIFAIFISVILSSFVTFLYEKFKRQSKDIHP